MARLKTFVERHPTLSYFALTFAISWGGVLFVIGGLPTASAAKAQDNPLFPFALFAMLAGPTTAGLLLTALLGGRAGLRAFRARLAKWRVAGRWYAVGLLAAPLVSIGVTTSLSVVSPEFRSALLVTNDRLGLLTLAIAVALAAGFFEELGWTGFAIPTLRRTHGIVATGLIVGLLWSTWHFLVVAWGIGDRAGAIPLAMFLLVDGVAGLPAFRVLMVQVYERTESLFLGVLMHVSITATTIALTPQTTGLFLLTYGVAFAGALWIVIAAIAIANRQHASRAPLRTQAA
jgi:membrane protease YdiL (CAAX protease family)